MKEVRLEVPIPARALWPNARPNRYEKADRAKRARIGARVRAQVAIEGNPPPRWEKAETQAVFYFATNRRRDADGAASSLKAIWDGIADAGVVANDSGLRHTSPEMRCDPANPRVVITIREVK